MTTRLKARIRVKTATDVDYQDITHEEEFEFELTSGVGTWHRKTPVGAVAPGTKVELTDLVSASKPVKFILVQNKSTTTQLEVTYNNHAGATSQYVPANTAAILADVDGTAADLYLIGAGIPVEVLMVGA
jgi:hypothetical protein